MSSNTKTAPETREGDFLIPCARLSFPKIWRPENVKGEKDPNKERYGCVLLVEKVGNEDLFKRLKAYKDKLIETSDHLKGKPKGKIGLYIADGDADDQTEECRGHWVISANRGKKQGRPNIVDRDMKPLAEEDGKMYAGCYVRAFISLYAPKEWTCVAASLEGLQFLRDGEAFGNKRTAESMFGAIEGDEAGEENEGEDDDDL